MNKFYLAGLNRVRGLKEEELRRLLAVFGDLATVWRASVEDLGSVGRLSPKLVAALDKIRNEDRDLPKRLAEECTQKNIKVKTVLDGDYPLWLKEIAAPPLAFFYRGHLHLGEFPIAMVGSRRCSQYGRGVTKELAKELTAAGSVIVSGAARGIDTASHQGALSKGATIAVLGCGVDVVYPAENEKLLAEIAASGAVISEQLPGTKPLPVYFPARNRIISGLTRGTVVVEAAARSGSLITAEMALNEGRDVFAVPGSIYFPTSIGCHKLLQQGAKLITSAADILSEYGVEMPQPATTEKGKSDLDLNEEEAALYKVLSHDTPLTADEIILRLKNSEAADVAFLLLQMELKGLVEETESHAYIRKGRMN